MKLEGKVHQDQLDCQELKELEVQEDLKGDEDQLEIRVCLGLKGRKEVLEQMGPQAQLGHLALRDHLEIVVHLDCQVQQAQ